MRIINSQRKIDTIQFEQFKQASINYKESIKQHEQSIVEMRRDLSDIYTNQQKEHERQIKLHQQMKQESEIIESYFQLIDTKKAERNARYQEKQKDWMLHRDTSQKRYQQIREEHSRKMSQSMIESLSQSINH